MYHATFSGDFDVVEFVGPASQSPLDLLSRDCERLVHRCPFSVGEIDGFHWFTWVFVQFTRETHLFYQKASYASVASARLARREAGLAREASLRPAPWFFSLAEPWTSFGFRGRRSWLPRGSTFVSHQLGGNRVATNMEVCKAN